MFRSLYFSVPSIRQALPLLVVLGILGVVNVRSQDTTSTRPVLDFEGNKVFAKRELLNVANSCLDEYAKTAYHADKLEYCLYRVSMHMRAKGYLQARLDKVQYEQAESGSKALIPVVEGALFRVGKIEVVSAKILAPAQILEMIDLKSGDIADGEKLSSAIYQRVKEAYGNFGYIQYTAEITPTFHLKEGADEGVCDFAVEIDEGQQFKIRSIKFTGGDKGTADIVRRELMVRDGEVYNQDLFSKSITRINNTGLYDRIDADRDVEYQTDEKTGLIDITMRLRKRIASASP